LWGAITRAVSGGGLFMTEFTSMGGNAAVAFAARIPGQIMPVEVQPGHVGTFEASVSFDITTIRGITNALFGGDGLFLVQLTGPGTDLAADADDAEAGSRAGTVSGRGQHVSTSTDG
jgi:uncharacterized protein (AIM24 family)